MSAASSGHSDANSRGNVTAKRKGQNSPPKAHLAIASQSHLQTRGRHVEENVEYRRDSGAGVERTGRVWCTPPPSRGPFSRPGSLSCSRSRTLPSFFQFDHNYSARRPQTFYSIILAPYWPCTALFEPKRQPGPPGTDRRFWDRSQSVNGTLDELSTFEMAFERLDGVISHST